MRICVNVLIQLVKYESLSQLFLSKKTNLHERFHTVKKALMTFHHDASNSHVPDINFLEFLLHVFSITRHYS